MLSMITKIWLRIILWFRQVIKLVGQRNWLVDHNVFDVNTTVNFKVSKAYFADGSELDAENMKKMKLDNAKQTITWINNGEDIAQPFTIDVEVCVNHKWGSTVQPYLEEWSWTFCWNYPNPS